MAQSGLTNIATERTQVRLGIIEEGIKHTSRVQGYIFMVFGLIIGIALLISGVMLWQFRDLGHAVGELESSVGELKRNVGDLNRSVTALIAKTMEEEAATRKKPASPAPSR